jgi:hypothetical protein
MAHYAFLNENNIVTEVITGRDEWEEVDGITDWEQAYGEIRGQVCKRTSYNNNYRKNYAGVGYYFDEDRDAFIAPKPDCHPDLITFDEETCRWNCSDASHVIIIGE